MTKNNNQSGRVIMFASTHDQEGLYLLQGDEKIFLLGFPIGNVKITPPRRKLSGFYFWGLRASNGGEG